ncbi:hypothetical protein F4775DRAFT_560588 [Biscogniauxia sp. FL1348]|nr:hypothetical protein F4775DRAFT_560588 [Biscogniauxia sp. FL1348]
MPSSGYRKGQIDGEEAGRAVDKGASSAMPNVDLAGGIYESVAQKDPVGEKTSGAGASIFDSSGAIGKQFTTEGALGGAAQKVGGPFAAQGMIGKQFTDRGAIGGTVQDAMGDRKKKQPGHMGAEDLLPAAGRNSSR